MTLYTINIPKISDTPYITVPVELNNETYYFEYSWNNRHKRAYLLIYLLDANIKTFLTPKLCLVNELEVSRYIINDRWTGGLFFISNDSFIDEYNIESISENFYLLYNSEYVGKHVQT